MFNFFQKKLKSSSKKKVLDNIIRKYIISLLKLQKKKEKQGKENEKQEEEKRKEEEKKREGKKGSGGKGNISSCSERGPRGKEMEFCQG